MTDSNDLQAFLYRSATANSRVAALVEAGRLAPAATAAQASGPSVLDQFDLEFRQRAKRMGRIYELLFCLENSMRELIERTLREVDDLNDWTDGLDPEVLSKAKDRERQDQAARWHGPRGESILSYLDFPDLGQAILCRWSDFQDLLGDRRWVDRYFGEMNPARRALAHTGDLTDFDVERMEMRVREWLMVVG